MYRHHQKDHGKRPTQTSGESVGVAGYGGRSVAYLLATLEASPRCHPWPSSLPGLPLKLQGAMSRRSSRPCIYPQQGAAKFSSGSSDRPLSTGSYASTRIVFTKTDVRLDIEEAVLYFLWNISGRVSGEVS